MSLGNFSTYKMAELRLLDFLQRVKYSMMISTVGKIKLIIKVKV